VHEFDLRRTSAGQLRGTRPDAIGDGVAHLIKACDELRLTYQIRLLTFMVNEQGQRLRIHVSSDTRISSPLAAFARENRRVVSIERDL
jgi:hypothetical protein